MRGIAWKTVSAGEFLSSCSSFLYDETAGPFPNGFLRQPQETYADTAQFIILNDTGDLEGCYKMPKHQRFLPLVRNVHEIT